jgi:hypothetical protein
MVTRWYAFAIHASFGGIFGTHTFLNVRIQLAEDSLFGQAQLGFLSELLHMKRPSEYRTAMLVLRLSSSTAAAYDDAS